ncbi:MAG: FdtA/QdtA family cupin domain-containing protein [Muribaculaceae bacterium]|nr:WxcM-like domain-containing protein [Bacteroides sp.]MDE6225948.1 FdtA/QdtA family cupin domain-containing protein [Muribaculaceae bacterium]
MVSSDLPPDDSAPRLIDLPRFLDHRGNLSVIEESSDIPFPIRRAYWVYDVPGGEAREGHAYHRGREFIVALSGSFDVVTDDGYSSVRHSLNRSYYGLYVPAGVWRTLTNFSTNSLALILSSTEYDPDDYIIDYHLFQAFAKK